MSAYVVDPRTIDYLIQWATRRRTETVVHWRHGWATWDEVPEGLHTGTDRTEGHSWRIRCAQVDACTLGGILTAQNLRSVRYRYPDIGLDDLVGQDRVLRYAFRPVPHLDPVWVLSCCRCLAYQSCETPDWPETLAHAIVEGIQASAIDAICDGAPWGVTDEHLRGPAPTGARG